MIKIAIDKNRRIPILFGFVEIGLKSLPGLPPVGPPLSLAGFPDVVEKNGSGNTVCVNNFWLESAVREMFEYAVKAVCRRLVPGKLPGQTRWDGNKAISGYMPFSSTGSLFLSRGALNFDFFLGQSDAGIALVWAWA